MASQHPLGENRRRICAGVVALLFSPSSRLAGTRTTAAADAGARCGGEMRPSIPNRFHPCRSRLRSTPTRSHSAPSCSTTRGCRTTIPSPARPATRSTRPASTGAARQSASAARSAASIRRRSSTPASTFVQFWDGRAPTLEEQAAGPVHNPIEMGSDWPEAVGKLKPGPLLPQRLRPSLWRRRDCRSHQGCDRDVRAQPDHAGLPFRPLPARRKDRSASASCAATPLQGVRLRLLPPGRQRRRQLLRRTRRFRQLLRRSQQGRRRRPGPLQRHRQAKPTATSSRCRACATSRALRPTFMTAACAPCRKRYA